MASQVEVAQRGAAGKGVKGGNRCCVCVCVCRRNARNDTSATSYELSFRLSWTIFKKKNVIKCYLLSKMKSVSGVIRFHRLKCVLLWSSFWCNVSPSSPPNLSVSLTYTAELRNQGQESKVRCGSAPVRKT